MGIELAERRSLTLEHARLWLRLVGLKDELDDIEGDPDLIRDARAILVDGTRRLATEVRASLEFHQTQTAAGGDIGHAVLTGVAASVPGFADALSAELGMPVETRHVAAAEGLSPTIDLGGMTVAAGLAVEEVLA
jgi:type IV pilus assembly protein PilM